MLGELDVVHAVVLIPEVATSLGLHAQFILSTFEQPATVQAGKELTREYVSVRKEIRMEGRRTTRGQCWSRVL